MSDSNRTNPDLSAEGPPLDDVTDDEFDDVGGDLIGSLLLDPESGDEHRRRGGFLAELLEGVRARRERGGGDFATPRHACEDAMGDARHGDECERRARAPTRGGTGHDGETERDR